MPKTPEPQEHRPLTDAEREAARQRLSRIGAETERLPPTPRIQSQSDDLPLEQDRPTRRRPASRAPDQYSYLLGKVALAAGLATVFGIWYLGASLTLSYLASVDVPIARWGILAWLIPVFITAVENGVMRAKVRSGWMWAVWLGVLAFDAWTTSLGLLDVIQGKTVLEHTFAATNITSQALVFVAGGIIALVPEPAGRSIWRELRS